MKYKIILLLLTACPIFVFSQSYPSADSANKRIMNGGGCDGRTFTKIEILPSLKISKQAFIDSISMYLKSEGISIEDGTIKLMFVVDCHSEIRNIQRVSGHSSDVSSLKNAILKSSSSWLPGRQNGYIASSIVLLEMGFKNNVLNNIRISQ